MADGLIIKATHIGNMHVRTVNDDRRENLIERMIKSLITALVIQKIEKKMESLKNSLKWN